MVPSILSPVDTLDSPPQLTSPSPFSIQPEDWSFTSKLALASIGSQGTMGGLLVAGFVSLNLLLKMCTRKLNHLYEIFGGS